MYLFHVLDTPGLEMLTKNFIPKRNFSIILPWKLKFQTFINCVGGVESCRSTPCHLSCAITNRLIPISRPHTSNPRLQAVKTFWPDFASLIFFFKNVLECQNRSKFARGPFSTYSTIWEKNILGSEKKVSFLIFRPLYLLT